MNKEVDFKNMEEDVVLIAELIGGGRFYLRSTLLVAHNALDEWKKYVLYSIAPDEKRVTMERPYFIYHFINQETKKTIASILFQNVMSMAIYPPNDDESEKWKGGQ